MTIVDNEMTVISDRAKICWMSREVYNNNFRNNKERLHTNVKSFTSNKKGIWNDVTALQKHDEPLQAIIGNLNKQEVNAFIYEHTPGLASYGIGLKRRCIEAMSAKHCLKGEVLAVEGQASEKAFLVLKGKLLLFRKIINDEVRDTNSRRKE